MTLRPHDVDDLHLAPVALHLDAELEQRAERSDEDIQFEVTLATNGAPISADERRASMLATLSHRQDLHGWGLEWCDRGLRLTHEGHSLVLGIPATVRTYLQM